MATAGIGDKVIFTGKSAGLWYYDKSEEREPILRRGREIELQPIHRQTNRYLRLEPTAESSDELEGSIHNDETDNDHPIEEVRLTVPITDNPTQPSLTFRALFIGTLLCAGIGLTNEIFSYRDNPIYISSSTAAIVAFVFGKVLAATLPTREFSIPFTNWSFTLNDGEFNMKEHTLIAMFASIGASPVYAINVITLAKTSYNMNINYLACILLVISTQMLGLGWVGIFTKYLVDSPYMWWPSTLVQVTLFKVFHGKEERTNGGTTKMQFFVMVCGASFVYHTFPSYFIRGLSAVSIICWLGKKSVMAQQIGSGLKGLGIGSLGFHWNTVAGSLGSPLQYPGFVVINILVGYFLFLYVIVPISYWNNIYNARKFPLISSSTYDSSGKEYNVSRILNKKTFDIDMGAYKSYSKLYLSITNALSHGLGFATLPAIISHVIAFHGGTILQIWRNEENDDVHTRHMKSYKQVPRWWFYCILVSMIVMALICCGVFAKELQLPLWGLVLSLVIAFLFTLPVGIIQATTDLPVGINLITELIIGYMHPGKPLANVVFKTYGYMSMAHALEFLSHLKLGQYMKINPRHVFFVQVVGSLVNAIVRLGASWWIHNNIPNICDASKLPEGSPWTCPGNVVFYHSSIIWGVVGPKRIFTREGIYSGLNWFVPIGLFAPLLVWLLRWQFPDNKLIKHIHIPLLIASGSGIPPAGAVNYITWGIVGIVFQVYLYRHFKDWWAGHTYLLSAALEASIAFMAVLLYFSLQFNDIVGPAWFGNGADDGCPLATCPTTPGVIAKGCPYT